MTGFKKLSYYIFKNVNHYKFNIIFYFLIIFVAHFDCGLLLYLMRYDLPFPGQINWYWPHIYQIVSCIIITLPYFMTNKNKWMVFIILFLFNLYLLANSLYFRTYYTVMPIESFLLTNNLKGLGPSIIASFKIIDILFFVPTVTLIILYYSFFKKNISTESIRYRFIFLCCIFGIIFIFIARESLRYYPKLVLWPGYRIFVIDQCSGLKWNGFVPYWIWQLDEYLKAKKPLTANEIATIEKYLASHNSMTRHLQFSENLNKNLIIILVESLESWPLELTINSKEITPCLNKLLRDEKTFYAPMVVVQTKNGRSSDAQLIINTGLLPINNGVVFSRFNKNNYYSIAKALKKKANYKAFSFMGNQPSFWHQGAMTPAFGFDSLISSFDYNEDDLVIGVLSDESFMKQTLEKIKKLPQPFYMQMITLTSHFPFKLPENKIGIHFPKTIPDELSFYLQSINYVDFALGNFIDGLKESGLFDRSVIIITGDHEALGSDVREKYIDNEYINRRLRKEYYVPLLMLNSSLKLRYEQIMGQIDIYPSILDLFGCTDYEWYGLGYSIFNSDKISFAVDCKYKIIGDTLGVARIRIEKALTAWNISDMIICHNYFESNR